MTLKRFLSAFFAVYIAGGAIVNVLLGPPGMSGEFTGDPKSRAAYEHYLEVVKSEPYKLWQQNPDMHPPDATPHLADNIAFVQAFETHEDFQAEMHRRERYKLSIECFHVVMMTVLFIGIGRRPLTGFLDKGIEQVRTRIAQAEAARNEAAQRRLAAETAIGRVDDEKAKILADGRRLIEQEVALIHDVTQQAVAQVRQSAQDRAHEEQQQAAMRVREAIFDAAANRIAERFRAAASEANHHVLIAEFARELEGRR